MGQLFMMGFDGTSVSPQIRSLIENYHLGSVLLSAKNLKCTHTPHPLYTVFIVAFTDGFFPSAAQFRL